MAESNHHRDMLSKVCRVCGDLLNKKQRKCTVKNIKMNLEKVFYLDFTNDLPEVHPQFVCVRCASLAKNVIERQSTPLVKNFNWKPHSEDCTVCEMKFPSGKKSKRGSWDALQRTTLLFGQEK